MGLGQRAGSAPYNCWTCFHFFSDTYEPVAIPGLVYLRIISRLSSNKIEQPNARDCNTRNQQFAGSAIVIANQLNIRLVA